MISVPGSSRVTSYRAAELRARGDGLGAQQDKAWVQALKPPWASQPLHSTLPSSRMPPGAAPHVSGREAMPKAALRLPAPPTKRQRIAPSVPEPAAAPPACEPPAVTVEQHAEGEAEPEEPTTLPNDTLAALQLLRSRFPAEVRAGTAACQRCHCAPRCLTCALYPRPAPHRPRWRPLPRAPSCTRCWRTAPPSTASWTSCGRATPCASCSCPPRETSLQSCSRLTTAPRCAETSGQRCSRAAAVARRARPQRQPQQPRPQRRRRQRHRCLIGWSAACCRPAPRSW